MFGTSSVCLHFFNIGPLHSTDQWSTPENCHVTLKTLSANQSLSPMLHFPELIASFGIRHVDGCVFRPSLLIEIKDVSWFDLKREMESGKVFDNGGQNQVLTGEKSTVSWQVNPLTDAEPTVGNVKEYLDQVENGKQSTADWNTQEKEPECEEPTIAASTIQYNAEELSGKPSLVWAEDVHQMERILKDYMQNTKSKFTSWKTTKGFLKESKYTRSKFLIEISLMRGVLR